MTKPCTYLLDADSFIRSKREHYAFDFCPAYWDALLRGFDDSRLLSIRPVRNELTRGKDALADWVKGTVPDEFFDSIDDKGVHAVYANVIEWARCH